MACAVPAMPLDSSEGFAEWAASVLGAHGVSDQAISAMREGIRDNELDGDVFHQGGPQDRELREGMRLPELPAIGEPRRPDHARCLLDGLAWRILHRVSAGRGGMSASRGEIKAWVRRVLPSCDGVCDVVEGLGGAVCELLPSEAGLLVPGAGSEASEGLLVSLYRMMSCLRSAAAQGCGLPDTESNVTVCVIGNTGAGKSTLLNALLGEESLLPTNAMRACTAAIIEIVYNFDFSADSSSHAAEIRFIPKEEWAAFVREAFQVLMKDADEGGQEGEEDEEMEDCAENEEEESLTKQLKSKLYAAYGKDINLAAGPETLLQKGGPINDNLGKVVTLRAASGRELREKYEQYVDSSNEASEGATWPIVQRVVLKGPWDLLCSGLRLVDAPGLQDDNSARDQVVRSYMRQADSIWLVSNIRRATNDKTTMDMMPAGFIQVLKDKGVAGSLAYIATQTDVMLRSEVIQNLSDRLSEASTQLECALARNNFFKETMADKVSRARGAGDDAEEAHDDSEEQGAPDKKGFEFTSFAVSAVDYQKIKGIRQGDGGPAVFRDEKSTEIPRLQEHVLKCAPALRGAKFKAGGALLDYLAEAKLRAAQEEEALLQELAILKNYRAMFHEVIDKVDHVGLTIAHGGQLALAAHTQNAILSLSVAGVGTIGLPLCEQQAAHLASTYTPWEGPGGERVSVVDGGRVTLSSGMRGLLNEAARRGEAELGLSGLLGSGAELVVNSLLVGQRGIPFAALARVPQCERAFGRMLVQLPSLYLSGGRPSVTVVHGGSSKDYDWGGDKSGESFFSVSTFSQCTIDVAPPSAPAAGRGLFLACDLLKPASVPGALPRLADNSEAETILRNAVRGMLRDKCEKIAIPLRRSLRQPPKVANLVEKEKALLKLLMDQTQLDVGFAVVQMQRDGSCEGVDEYEEDRGRYHRYGYYAYDDEDDGEYSDRDIDEDDEIQTRYSCGNVHDVDGKDMGFRFNFVFEKRKSAGDEGKDEEDEDEDEDEDEEAGEISCRDIISKEGGEFGVFEDAHCEKECNRHESSASEVYSRVVLVVWPRERTFQLQLSQGELASVLSSVQELVRSKDPTAALALQAVAEGFANPVKGRDPTAETAVKLLQLFTDSGGLAPEAICLVIKSVPAIWAKLSSPMSMHYTIPSPPGMRQALLRVVAVYGWETVKGSFLELAGALGMDRIDEHIIAAASDLKLQGHTEFEQALLNRLLSGDRSLPRMHSAGAAELIKAAFSHPGHAAQAAQLTAALEVLPVEALRLASEHFISQAPNPEALSRCKQLARVVLRRRGFTLFSLESGRDFVRMLLRLDDGEINELCISCLGAADRMLIDFIQGLVLGSAGVESAVATLGPSLRALDMQAACRVFKAVRADALSSDKDIGRFTQCMFKIMREKAGAYVPWADVMALMDVVLPKLGVVRAHDGASSAVVADMLCIFFASLKYGANGTSEIFSLVSRLKANGARCQEHLNGIAGMVQRSHSPDVYTRIFTSLCDSADPSMREMIRAFAQPYIDSTSQMCLYLQAELISKLCAVFCSTRELSRVEQDAFFGKFLPIFMAKAKATKASLLTMIFQEPRVKTAASKHIVELATMHLADLKSSPSAQKPAAENYVRPGSFEGVPHDPAQRIRDVNTFLVSGSQQLTVMGFNSIAEARSWALKVNKMPNLFCSCSASGSARNSRVYITKTDAGQRQRVAQHEANLKSQTDISCLIAVMKKRVETGADIVVAAEAEARRAPAPPAAPAPAPAPAQAAPPQQAVWGHHGPSASGGVLVGVKRTATETPDTATKKHKPGGVNGAAPANAVFAAGAAPAGVLSLNFGAAPSAPAHQQRAPAVGASASGNASALGGASAGGDGAAAAALGGAPAAPPPNPPAAAAGPMVIDLTEDDD